MSRSQHYRSNQFGDITLEFAVISKVFNSHGNPFMFQLQH